MKKQLFFRTVSKRNLSSNWFTTISQLSTLAITPWGLLSWSQSYTLLLVMYIQTYTFIYICVYAQIYHREPINICIYIWTYIHSFIYIWTYIHSFIYTYIWSYIHSFIYIYIIISNYIYMYIYIYIYIHRFTIYIYIYIYTHVYIQLYI